MAISTADAGFAPAGSYIYAVGFASGTNICAEQFSVSRGGAAGLRLVLNMYHWYHNLF